MIHIGNYRRNNKNCFVEETEKYNTGKEPNLAKGDNFIGWHKSYNNKFIWLAHRINEACIRITVSDEDGKSSHIELKDDFRHSDVSFVNLPDENMVIVSLSAGQDGSQDFCIAFIQNKLRIVHKFPKNLTYIFTFNKAALAVDFYTADFYKISSNDFQIESIKTYSIFENDALSNVWMINGSFGIFCTTEGKWYVFSLKTLELIDELAIEGISIYSDCCGINTLYQTRDELVFRHYELEGGEAAVDWISVDKMYLNKIIRDKLAKNNE